MNMRTQQRSVYNTLRSLYLLTTFLFASLCTCCGGCFAGNYKAFDPSTNLSLTSERGKGNASDTGGGGNNAGGTGYASGTADGLGIGNAVVQVVQIMVLVQVMRVVQVMAMV